MQNEFENAPEVRSPFSSKDVGPLPESSLQQEEPTEVNVLARRHDSLQYIISAGLIHHQCELFHDQVFSIGELKQKRIPYRESIVLGLGLPVLCEDGCGKLGCAHAGSENKDFGGGKRRSIDAPTRSTIIGAIEDLTAYAPELLSTEEAASLIARVQQLGVEIAQLDASMSDQSRKEQIIQRHSACVEELYNLAVETDKLIKQAMDEGKGVISMEDYRKEMAIKMPKGRRRRRR